MRDALRTEEGLQRPPCLIEIRPERRALAAASFGLFAVPMRDIVRIHASSGTTGQPTVVGYTRGDIEVWSDVCARSIRAAGGGPDDLVHVAYGYGLFTGGLGAHYGAERLGATVIPSRVGRRRARCVSSTISARGFSCARPPMR